MAAYATVQDVQARMTNTMTAEEQTLCSTLLNDAAVMIDAYNANADAGAKLIVSCRMVIRAMGTDDGVPLGATQGSMSALGYTQSWTLGNSASVGELYIGRAEKKLLGAGGSIGSYSPTEELVEVVL